MGEPIALLAMLVVTTVLSPRKKSKSICSAATMLTPSKPRSPMAKIQCLLLVKNLDLMTLMMLQTGFTSKQPNGTEEATFFHHVKLLPFFVRWLEDQPAWIFPPRHLVEM